MGILDIFKREKKLVTGNKEFMIPLSSSQLYPVSKFTDYNSFLSAAKTISWVYKCSSIIGENVATTQGFVYDSKDQEMHNPILDQLFTLPNEWMTWYDMKEVMTWYLLLTGNAYILKDEINLKGQPTKLYLIRPDRMQIVPSKNEFIAGYQYDVDGHKYPFTKDEIIHLKLPNPTDELYGMGKIEACKVVYDTEIAASTYNWNFFQQGASPSGVLTNPSTLDEDTYRRLQKQFSQRHTGYQKMLRTLLLEQGTQYTQLGLSQQDMAFMEQRKFTREEILSIFGVPPAKAGILEHASYANTKEQENTFRKDTLKPLLIRLQNWITLKIVSNFNEQWHYEFEEVVERDEKMYFDMAIAGVNNTLLTPNEAREQYLVLEKVNDPAMDSYYAPFSLAPITGAQAEANAAEAAVIAPTEKPVEEAPAAAPIKHICGGHKSQKVANIQQAFLKLSELTKKKVSPQFKKASKEYFSKVCDEVIYKLNMGKSFKKIEVADLINNSLATKKFKKKMEESSINLMITALNDVSDILKVSLPDNPLEGEAFQRIVGKLGVRIDGIKETFIDQIDATLADGITAGESIPELVKRINSLELNKTGWEATRIARTESAYAYDRGAIYGYGNAGVATLDVIGCTMIEDNFDCGAVNVPIDEASELEFHPNHTGTFVPSFGVGE